MMGENVEVPTQHDENPECEEDGHFSQLKQERRIPWDKIIFNHLCIMTRTKAVLPTILDNIWWILEYTGMPMRMFSINFQLEYYN